MQTWYLFHITQILKQPQTYAYYYVMIIIIRQNVTMIS